MSNESTGPRTDEGKARSSMNAVKHGLRAQTIVLPHESAAEWEALRRATREQYRPQGMIEEELVDPVHVAQIGIRGTGYAADDFDWLRGLGACVVTAEECWNKSLTHLMDEVRTRLGQAPVYVTFDIDGLDPSVAPGTGTPEIGGLTGAQGLEIIRGCRGLDLVGADVVEVSPPYDASGNTALVAANLAFELLCVMPGVEYRT